MGVNLQTEVNAPQNYSEIIHLNETTMISKKYYGVRLENKY